jgi:plastocyanin
MGHGERARGGWIGPALGALCAALAIGARGAAASDASAQIEIRNFHFVPAALEVHAGDTITWVNDDEEIHSILSSQGLFTSPALDGAQHFSYRFEKPGTYEYRCALHPQMKGMVVVR